MFAPCPIKAQVWRDSPRQVLLSGKLKVKEGSEEIQGGRKAASVGMQKVRKLPV